MRAWWGWNRGLTAAAAAAAAVAAAALVVAAAGRVDRGERVRQRRSHRQEHGGEGRVVEEETRLTETLLVLKS